MTRKVSMPERVYLAEHKRLIKLLASGDKRFKKEAKAQQAKLQAQAAQIAKQTKPARKPKKEKAEKEVASTESGSGE